MEAEQLNRWNWVRNYRIKLLNDIYHMIQYFIISDKRYYGTVWLISKVIKL